ncbi:hypothetical protein JCM6882_001259 [Rhodosporidiobolus microsporus]
MAPSAPYPRTTLRTILRSHSTTASTKQPQLSARAEVVAWVAYLAHLERLAGEVKALHGVEKGDKGQVKGGKRVKVGKADVRRASRRLLKQIDG